MERTVALIPHAFSGTTSAVVSLDAKVQSQLLSPDVFSNPDHLKFAVRGALATMLAYVLYQAIDSPGLSTAVIICTFTALSTVEASRQSQLLRLVGAIVGGFGFGMGAQVLLLPYLDSIAGFIVLSR
jgi:multidrug resistance protein MdtO